MAYSRPDTTLFMLMSLDGKISTGSNDQRDIDKDFKHIAGIQEGLAQYYEIEKTTELYSLNTGRVMEKIGINSRTDTPTKSPVSFFIIDSKPHLNENGIRYLCNWLKTLFIVTNNEDHPAIQMQENRSNLKVLTYSEGILFTHLMSRIKNEFNVDKLTIQSGGKLNAILLRNGLVDHIDIIIVPAIIGGSDTSTLVDGYSLESEKDLLKIKPLKLISCEKLENSYLRLKYDVI